MRQAKTDAGIHTAYMLDVLRDELGDYRARINPAPDARVFGTATGAKQGATNVRRILAPAVEQANRLLAKQKLKPLPDGLTPHSLRSGQ